MFKKLIPLLVIAFLSITVSAQTPGFRIGPRVAIGQSNFRTDSLPGETGRLMWAAGLHANYQFNKMIALEAEGLFVSKGAKASGRRTPPGFLVPEQDYEEEYKMYYIEVPIMLKVSIPLGNLYLKAFAGPSINFNVDAKYNVDYDNSDDYDQKNTTLTGIKTTELSGVVGVGLDVEVATGNVFSIDARYNAGLSPFGTIMTSGNDGYNNYFGVFAGWSF